MTDDDRSGVYRRFCAGRHTFNPYQMGLVMTKKFSFTRHERQTLPNFRQKISKAESTEDVKKFFVYTVKEFLTNVFEGKMEFDDEALKLIPDSEPYFRLSERLLSSKGFTSVWNDSDLPRVITRLAESSIRRYKHLERHPEKTISKIRM